MPALRAAGYLPQLGLDWYVDTFEADSVFDRLHLLEALIYAEVQPEFAWIMTHFRPRDDEEYEGEYNPLIRAIGHFNLQAHVRELGHAWCASVFKPWESLLQIMKVCSMLTTAPGKEWYVAMFGSEPDVLEYVLRDAGF
jgi:hypothetical protein